MALVFGLNGLHRKVAVYMAAMAVGGLAISTLGWALLYALFFDARVSKDQEFWGFHATDYAALAVFAAIGIIIALGAAANLSKRIVSPLTSVASAARRLADGDLGARAMIDDLTMGEVVDLAHDFNLMAVRIETLAGEAIQWNATIAHELRTPLTIIRGRLQGVADGVFPMDKALLASVLTQVESLSRLVEDLRTLSLAESGHLYVRPTTISLLSCIETMRAFMDAPLRKAGFDVTWQSNDDIEVSADGTRIAQALLALLENARIHARPGALRVTLRRDGDSAALAVSDIGPGIPEQEAESIFDPFKASGSKKVGSGLGLAVVSSIAKAHGGIARCTPSPEGGSTFEILLPCGASADI